MAFISSIPVTARPQMRNGLTTARPVRNARNSRTSPTMVSVEANNVGELDTILGKAAETLVIVDYSTSWCGPCKIIAPKFEALSDSYPEAVFVKVMGDSSPETTELMRREGIRSVPAFHYWKNGEKVKIITGNRPDELERVINEFI